jgi:threonine dehydrogenase-like Zn-dependent dehydrogenase
MSTCRAAVIEAPGKRPVVADVTVPHLEPGGMLVEVEAATLCGTDVHFWHADVPGSPSEPYIPGHETSGRIVELVGLRRDVTGDLLRVGDRVIWTYPFCRRCYYCSIARDPAQCVDMLRFGRTPSGRFPYLVGGCAEFHYVPPGSEVIRVTEGVSAAMAAMASCALRTVMHAMEVVRTMDHQPTVMVQGCGAVGLLAVAVARSRGAGEILAIGDPPDRHGLARRFGANQVVGLSVGVAERKEWALDATGGRGVDVVIECATSAAIPEGLDLLRPGGIIVCVGGGGVAPPIRPEVFAKGLRLTAIRGAEGRHYRSAIMFMESNGNLPFDELIGPPVGLAETGSALEDMAALRQIKPLIAPRA